MNPNSDLKNNESVMAANAESSTIKASNAETSTVDAGYAEHIEPNPREIGNGHYVFPETLGREKRVNSIIKSMEE